MDFENPNDKAFYKVLRNKLSDPKNAKYYSTRFKGKYAGYAVKYKSNENTLVAVRYFILMLGIIIVAQSFNQASKDIDVVWAFVLNVWGKVTGIPLFLSGVLFQRWRSIAISTASFCLLLLSTMYIIVGSKRPGYDFIAIETVFMVVIFGFILSGFYNLSKSSSYRNLLDEAITNGETY